MNSLSKNILRTASCVLLTLSTSSTSAKTPNLIKSESNWEGSLIIEGIYFDSHRSHSSHDEEHEHEDGDDHNHEKGHDHNHGHGHSHEHGHSHAHATIPGFPSAGHEHGFREGLHTGHMEAVVSGNINSLLKTRVTAAMLETEDEGLEVELEEAFVETQGLGKGFTIKAGRFFTDVGYLSSKHNHEWDFADAALIYRGMFGAHPNFDGLQLSYVAPTDIFLQVGTELFQGDKFPASNSKDTIGAVALFAKMGGDISLSHSWQLGIGHWRADDINDRMGDLHEHGRTDGSMHSVTPSFSGNSRINTINAVYKWAPNGNSKERNFKFQVEYFKRDEGGYISMVERDGSIERNLNYQGEQDGFYIQGVYQFRPHWRVGLRHDRVASNNILRGSSGELASEHQVEAAGLATEGHTPKRNSIMIDYTPREYSRLRLQFNEDKTTAETDKQIILQYTHSFGSHGAHGF